MDKIDRLIARLATTDCRGKVCIGLNMGGNERLKQEIYKILNQDEVLEILLEYNIDRLKLTEISKEIVNLLKK